MMERPLADDEREAFWRRAADRLALVDVEPPVSMDEIDDVFNIVGPRPASATLTAWLKIGALPEAPSSPTAGWSSSAAGSVTSLDSYRQRFRPVATFVRLAADSAGSDIGLPAGPLETDNGQFRLSVSADDGDLRIEIQALGMVSADWSGRRMGLSDAADDQPLLAVFRFDDDGDATIVIKDTPEHRRALLRPIIGGIDEA